MSRFITIPAPFELLNPVTDTFTGQIVTFAEVVRAIFSDDRMFKKLDIYTALDVRTALVSAHVGDVVELRDKEWEAVRSLLLVPEGDTPAVSIAVVYSGGNMLRAITDAPTAPPVQLLKSP